MITDPMLVVRRILERERFNKNCGDGALSEMIIDAVDLLIRAAERADYGDHMYDVGYQRGVDDTKNRLSGPVSLRETDPRLISSISLLADDYGLAGVASTAYQMKYQSIVPASRIAESDTFLRAMEVRPAEYDQC